MFTASKAGDASIVISLLQAGVDPNALNTVSHYRLPSRMYVGYRRSSQHFFSSFKLSLYICMCIESGRTSSKISTDIHVFAYPA